MGGNFITVWVQVGSASGRGEAKLEKSAHEINAQPEISWQDSNGVALTP